MCEGGEGPQNGVWKPPPQDCLALLSLSVPPYRLCVHQIPCLNVDSPGPPPANTPTPCGPHPQATLVTHDDAGHPASHTSFCSFIFVVNLGVADGGWGRGPSWVGAGGGVIALSSLSPGGLSGGVGGRASALGPARGRQGRTNTQVTAQGQVGRGEAGRHIALQERGVRWGPRHSNWSLGRRLEVIVSPSLAREGR